MAMSVFHCAQSSVVTSSTSTIINAAHGRRAGFFAPRSVMPPAFLGAVGVVLAEFQLS